MSFLLDTNVLSEARKPAGNANVKAWIASVNGTDLYLSVLVLGEAVEIAEEWGRLNSRDPRPAIDSLLAASAKVMGLTLVTRNSADVASTGVAVLNPFEAQTR